MSKVQELELELEERDISSLSDMFGKEQDNQH